MPTSRLMQLEKLSDSIVQTLVPFLNQVFGMAQENVEVGSNYDVKLERTVFLVKDMLKQFQEHLKAEFGGKGLLYEREQEIFLEKIIFYLI